MKKADNNSMTRLCIYFFEGQAKMLVKNTTMPFLKRGTCSQRKSRFYLVKVEHFQKFLILCYLKPSYRQDRLQLGTTGYKLHFRLNKFHFLSRSSQFVRKRKKCKYCLFPFHDRLQKSIHFVQNKGGFLFRKKRTFIPKINLTVFIFSILYRRQLRWVCWWTWPDKKIQPEINQLPHGHKWAREGKNVNNDCFRFMIDFKSLYTLSKIKEVSYSERNDLYSKNHPDSVHFLNVVQETIVLGMLMNLARRKFSARNKSTASRT